MKSELKKKYHIDPGSLGLPKDYPVPPQDPDLLFYIQRNQNQDTIVYKLNRNLDGLVNKDLPMHAYWIKYSEGGIKKELNLIQSELAFGYSSQEISPDLYSFTFLAYKTLKFYIVRNQKGNFEVICDLENNRMTLNHIYVYAMEFGVFPDVKFIEFYGNDPETGIFAYDKITIS